jgi:heme exporter protein B
MKQILSHTLLIFRRELLLLSRGMGDWLLTLSFFLLLPVLAILGLGIGFVITLRFALVILFVSLIFAIVLSLDRVLQAESDRGQLDHLRLTPIPLSFAVFAKSLAHASVLVLPLILLAPILLYLMVAAVFSLPVLLLLWGVIGITGFILTMLGSVIAALAVGARRAHLLIPLLLLPLAIPLLIFAVATLEGMISSFGWQQPVLFLVALFLLSLILCPFAAAFALDQSEG